MVVGGIYWDDSGSASDSMVGAYSGLGEKRALLPYFDVHIPSTFLYRYEVLIDTRFCRVSRFDHEVVVAITMIEK